TEGEEGAGRPDVSPGHAGWFETSLMLAARPELVRTPVPARTPVEPPPLFDQPPHPGLTVERHGEWERVDGSTDDASAADADRGGRLLDDRARGLARAIRAFDAASR
ncbi:creatininase family protein, partial [Streptomyces sp. E5N298]